MAMKLMWLALAGSLGTLCRYGLSGLMQRLTGSLFPWGTISVNIIGCLLFGLVWSVLEERVHLSSEMRVIILTGFMGAFTTFSTFMFETGQLLKESQYLLALGNVGLQNIVGLAALFLGLLLGRLL